MRWRRIYWLIVVLTGIAAALVTLVVILAPRTVPLSQCSEVYRRYCDVPGIQASFIKNKQINDTLRLDMTLLEAQDSANYVWLLKDLEYSDELIEFYMSVGFLDEDSRFTGKYNNSIIVDFPQRKTVVFFDTDNEMDKRTILRENFKESLKINQK